MIDPTGYCEQKKGSGTRLNKTQSVGRRGKQSFYIQFREEVRSDTDDKNEFLRDAGDPLFQGVWAA